MHVKLESHFNKQNSFKVRTTYLVSVSLHVLEFKYFTIIVHSLCHSVFVMNCCTIAAVGIYFIRSGISTGEDDQEMESNS